MSGRRPQRHRGAKGPIGLTGAAGAAGSTSLSSATPFWMEQQDPEEVFPIPGPAGVAGAAGAAGGAGAPGAPGAAGVAGAMGLPGLDGIDGEDAIAPFGWPAFGVTTITSAVTGFINDYAPGLGKFTIEHWSGVNDAAFTGLRGGIAGSIYVFKNLGTHVGSFAHQSGASAAGNKFANPVVSAPLPVAQGGSITYAHDGTSWQLVGHGQGREITPAFAAGVFNGSASMTWAVDPGDVQAFAYTVDGLHGSMTLFCALTATSVGGVVNPTLLVTIPGAFTSSLIQVNAGGRVSDNGVDGVGIVFSVGSASSQISIIKIGSGSFTLSTNNTTVQFTITFQLT